MNPVIVNKPTNFPNIRRIGAQAGHGGTLYGLQEVITKLVEGKSVLYLSSELRLEEFEERIFKLAEQSPCKEKAEDAIVSKKLRFALVPSRYSIPAIAGKLNSEVEDFIVINRFGDGEKEIAELNELIPETTEVLLITQLKRDL
jgi:hypothetical protein